jgi:LAGLIDADG DNA endonuclease family
MKDLAMRRYILKTLKLKDYRLKRRLPNYLNQALIGLLLSDGGLEKSTVRSNVRLSVIMSMDNYPYILHLYNLFEPYINTDLRVLGVKVYSEKEVYKYYSTVRFKTISMPQLLYYYNIFYKKNIMNNKREKRVPIELKSNFNAVSLAHLIMGDGNYLRERNIIRIYTNSFIKEDVILLSNIINENLSINNKVIHDRNNQYIIVIEKDSINNTRDVLLPYMHPSVLYKVGMDRDIVSTNKFNYLNIIDNI